jgi:hypothetical protein
MEKAVPRTSAHVLPKVGSASKASPSYIYGSVKKNSGIDESKKV